MMREELSTLKLLIVISSATALFAINGCGAGLSDDADIANDAVVTDSVDIRPWAIRPSYQAPAIAKRWSWAWPGYPGSFVIRSKYCSAMSIG